MAKRRTVRREDGEKEETKEKPSFVAPEFDETDFLQTENRSAKMIYLSLASSLLAAVVSFFLMRGLYLLDVGNYRIIPVAVPIMMIPLVLYVFTRFGLDIKSLGWKKYLENGFMYFAAWAAVFLLSMNPPFSDFTRPSIGGVVVKVTDGSGKELWYLNETVHNYTQGDRSMEVFCLVTDNWRVEDLEINVFMRAPGSEWYEVPENASYGIVIEKVKNESQFDMDKDLSDIMEDSWYGDDFENWEGYLHVVRFENLSLLDLEMEYMIRYYVKDPRGNSRTLEYPFVLSKDDI